MPLDSPREHGWYEREVCAKADCDRGLGYFRFRSVNFFLE